jgi:hypothetical protein
LFCYDKRRLEMKQWEQPKLIILVRGQPEESILSVCKGALADIGSPIVGVMYCVVDVACTGPCEQFVDT